MKRFFFLVVVLAAWTAWPPASRAEHATIALTVTRFDSVTGQTNGEAMSSSDQEPPLGGVLPRPSLKVKVAEPLLMQFFLTNAYPHGVTKDVTVRYFVVRTGQLRQKSIPDPKDGAVLQGEIQMNFKPKCRVGARVAFRLEQPGIYLLRIDTLNTSSDHEHFSAIDLQAE